MCRPKGYGFSAVLVRINKLSIETDFGHFSHKLGDGFCTLALIWVCLFYNIVENLKENDF